MKRKILKSAMGHNRLSLADEAKQKVVVKWVVDMVADMENETAITEQWATERMRELHGLAALQGWDRWCFVRLIRSADHEFCKGCEQTHLSVTRTHARAN